MVTLKKKEIEPEKFLTSSGVANFQDLTIKQIQDFCLKEGLNFSDLLFYNLKFDMDKAKKIKLLIFDVDGVMTDGGMYFTAFGDQIKKYNTKDGMGILKLKNTPIETGIISSGTQLEVVKSRAELLQIKHLYVGKEPKLKILSDWCKKLNVSFTEVGVIGDDINDLEMMEKVGLSACPSDAVEEVKSKVNLVLQKRGGEGSVREWVDYFLKLYS